jgi:hypothetical protein
VPDHGSNHSASWTLTERKRGSEHPDLLHGFKEKLHRRKVAALDSPSNRKRTGFKLKGLGKIRETALRHKHTFPHYDRLTSFLTPAQKQTALRAICGK